MSALPGLVRSGVTRRRMQSAVIGLAALLAVTAALLGGSLLVVSSTPFEDAFAAQSGAHLSASFTATAQEVGATAGTASASAGPFPTASTAVRVDRIDLPPITVVGRADPGGSVDRLTLVEGEWADGPGEIVVATSFPMDRIFGRQVTLTDLPGDPVVKVVGVARSVTRTAEAWVAPSVLTAPQGYQMLYRLAAPLEVDAALADVTAAVPEGAVAGSRSWLTAKQEAVRESALFVPFLVAFGVLGLVMSVLVVGNVVAGAVASGVRRIGVLKALGCTPRQVVWTYVGQALVPASFGVLLGVVAGNLLAIPVLGQTEEVYDASLSVPLWIDVVVVAGVLGVVTVTAWVSAFRAGRLRTVDALAVGRTGGARGRFALRWFARLPLPLALGLARPFARPARAFGMTAAVVFGTAAVTFAVGLGVSLGVIQSARDYDTSDVTVGVEGPMRPDRVEPDPGVVAAALSAQAGTDRYFGLARAEMTVPGMAGFSQVYAYSGDASWGGHPMIAGSWYSGAGEAVVPTAFLTATGRGIGDTVSLQYKGKSVSVRIVGELFDTRHDGLAVYLDAGTFPELRAEKFFVSLKPGTDVQSYVDGVNSALGSGGVSAFPSDSGQLSDTILVIGSLTALLTLLLVTVSALGVLNTVLLDTRDRVRDLGIQKSLGMTPRQTVAVVVSSVGVVGLAGGALGVPLGTALHDRILPAMGRGAGTNLPAAAFTVYSPLLLAGLVVGGMVIAVLGALPPAGWAARTRTATALRTE
ncbi:MULTISPECIES: ABC transporter permease [unclassified Saccharothrix]|uniref:ABC transporter permease n=1 Tax=unclassified Saccharothrix TaxID=2593673 RepID=UPI00307D31CE